MYEPIFDHEDGLGHRVEVLTLDSPHFRLTEPDPEPNGRLLLAVSKGSCVLELSSIARLRDSLTDHLSDHPDSNAVPALT